MNNYKTKFFSIHKKIPSHTRIFFISRNLPYYNNKYLPNTKYLISILHFQIQILFDFHPIQMKVAIEFKRNIYTRNIWKNLTEIPRRLQNFFIVNFPYPIYFRKSYETLFQILSSFNTEKTLILVLNTPAKYFIQGVLF